MTIQILPARLANQIAAGEVVERPASVVKELVENSLDAGATDIVVEIDKGGAKRIKISDNGQGIVKDELTLALSRHATSKIKDLDDLESIASLGFRGEALASISSVARLTLTSKPQSQATAWQAYAEGRDMQVIIKPAAHADGTTIDVEDLFFNTPARRKFMRTEKTEFSHIDEVIKRIALARFDIAFTLIHNGKEIRKFKTANSPQQQQKRVAAICGKNFIDNALTLDCQHDNMRLWGWVGLPQVVRSQNDLNYSYVNGRMMRDKLINHAIRQAYGELIDSHSYPPFVLYFTLDHREVDVNVHPAKHEVRFHQSRYVHDFIFSVIAKALDGQQQEIETISGEHQQLQEVSADYIRPLTTNKPRAGAFAGGYGGNNSYSAPSAGSSLAQAADNYQQLMSTPVSIAPLNSQTSCQLILMASEDIAVLNYDQQLWCLCVKGLAAQLEQQQLLQAWHQGLVSQPLLLPVKLKLDKSSADFIARHQQEFNQAGIHFTLEGKSLCQIRQFPARLRHRDVTACFTALVTELCSLAQHEVLTDQHWCEVISPYLINEDASPDFVRGLLRRAEDFWQHEFSRYLSLNSLSIDLTSYVETLTARN
jgi:DNA mismatch repair protein MutL